MWQAPSEYVQFGERNNVEIKTLILHLAAMPHTTLEIMNKLYLSHRVAVAIINELLADGLLDKVTGNVQYTITQDGQKWLDRLR